MPLQTFKNLDTNRQEEIRQVAYKEFAMNEYKNASVSTIVKNLGLAKGSFYRYFESKLDLYTYLLEYATKIRMLSINRLVSENQLNFRDIIIENFKNKIEFDLEYPLESVFTYKVLIESHNPEIQHLIVQLKQSIFQFVEQLLLAHIKENQIRQNIDIQLTTFTIFQIQVGLFDYLSIYKGVNFIQNIKEGKTIFSMGKEEIMNIVEKMVEILMDGIGKR